ncbi:hypothetical protein [Streptomyces sp. AJS327]|nr:hypothetical protein [Streptomyces sp. AJS327]
MSAEFWRTVQHAIERDTWTARLIAISLTMGALALSAYVVVSQ